MIQNLDIALVPDKPGVYVFRDASGSPLYVGKAKSLKHRLMSYFGGQPADSKTLQMLEEARSVDWTVASNEAEALLLEYNLIQHYRPRYNIRLRDDKSFPYLVVSFGEEWPRAFIARGRRKRGWRYFGPYAHAHAIRETLDLLRRVYPIRTCTNVQFKEHQVLGRPCLYYDIAQCAGPCVGKVSKEEYDQLVARFCKAVEGADKELVRELETKMWEAAEAEEFERAALYRNRLQALQKVAERQQVLKAKSQSLDAVGFAMDELQARLDVFGVRNGALKARYGYLIEIGRPVSEDELLAEVLLDLYGGSGAKIPFAGESEDRGAIPPAGSEGYTESSAPAAPKASGDSARATSPERTRLPESIPPTILVPLLPRDKGALEELFSKLRGGRVVIATPKDKNRRQLMEMVVQNAREALERHKLQRAADHNARSRALLDLASALGLEEAPLRIECFDISNTGPSEVVGSMVVFEDGLPKKSDYRRYKLRTLQGQDDFASMKEVVFRRAKRLAEDRKSKGFRYDVGLVLVDGGPGQLSAARAALEEAGEPDVPVAALAKRLEEVYLPGRKEPVVLPRDSEALFLLQRIRDEAHRFALSYHRKRRNLAAFSSPLDSVKGLGQVRKKRLLEAFRSLDEIANAGPEELAVRAGLPLKVARAVQEALATEGTIRQTTVDSEDKSHTTSADAGGNGHSGGVPGR